MPELTNEALVDKRVRERGVWAIRRLARKHRELSADILAYVNALENAAAARAADYAVDSELPAFSALQASVWEWVEATFEPRNRPRSFVFKAEEELDELRDSLDSEEAADVTIAMLAFCACVGASLEDLIIKKMERNRRRTWVQNADGVASHVKEASDE